jgi:hypothetical protein
MVGWELAVAVNAFSYLGWALWLVVAGATLLRRPPAPPSVEERQTAALLKATRTNV